MESLETPPAITYDYSEEAYAATEARTQHQGYVVVSKRTIRVGNKMMVP